MPVSKITTSSIDALGYGFKNRIINGAMVIDQRNAGASGTAQSTYTVDRFGYYGTQASKGTWQQNAGSVTPPAGFKNYLGFTSSSAYSVLSTDLFEFYQPIEGYNVADLGFGAVGAATVTLSFWVRSSLTGTFGGGLTNSGNTRNYPFTYTISSANTWEQKTITVAGDTTGTWNTTNGGGIIVIFGLGAGSTYSGTANAWNGTTSAILPTGATSVVGTNGATFYITGVQLEKGNVATSFDYRPYGTELALCQRYYQKSFSQSNAPNSTTATTDGAYASINRPIYTNFAYTTIQYPVVMRGSPTLVVYNVATGATGSVRNTSNTSNATVDSYSANDSKISALGSSAGQFVTTDTQLFHFTLSAEL